jgi:hypothetical protein
MSLKSLASLGGIEAPIGRLASLGGSEAATNDSAKHRECVSESDRERP